MLYLHMYAIIISKEIEDNSLCLKLDNSSLANEV